MTVDIIARFWFSLPLHQQGGLSILIGLALVILSNWLGPLGSWLPLSPEHHADLTEARRATLNAIVHPERRAS